MRIELRQPFAASGRADENDVRQMKIALNRLGYYRPYEKTGITGIPDKEIFAALRAFQKDNGLPQTGAAKPGDETETAIRKLGEKRKGRYIWRTVSDSKVRKEHAALDGLECDWADFPAPGDEEGCRCWAVEVEKEDIAKDAIKPVYPELAIPALRGLKPVIGLIKTFFTASKKFTGHGKKRASQRNISQKEIDEAIKTAKENGNVVTKTGKYGTQQDHYTGSNGVTVIIEIEGRNAGKIITVWRQ